MRRAAVPQVERRFAACRRAAGLEPIRAATVAAEMSAAAQLPNDPVDVARLKRLQSLASARTDAEVPSAD